MTSPDRKLKIGLICSSGGHLYQLHVLRPWWSQLDRFWVTFDKVDACSMLEEERTYFAHFPTNRNFKNLLRNFFVAWRVLRRERPDLLISTGAGVAIPFFVLGKLLGARLVFLEVFDRIDSPTLTGRVLHPLCDKFLVQWPEQLEFFPGAEIWGRAL